MCYKRRVIYVVLKGDYAMNNNFKFNNLAKFLIPSIFGILFLMTPFNKDGSTTVAVSVISKGIFSFVNGIIPIYYLVFICVLISCVLSVIYKFKRFDFMEKTFIKDIVNVSYFWLTVRFIGLILCFLTLFHIGPSFIHSDATGGLILFDLICGLFTIFLVAGFILPFLTEFGLLEYVGVYLTNIMRPLFNLPGRSAVDCVASWVGDGTIGIALTNKQYEQGYYSEKEAAIIATSFSAVSITFCLVVIENVNLVKYFGLFYFTVSFVGVINALVLPKFYPLAKKKNTYLVENENLKKSIIPDGYSKHLWGLKLAVDKANDNFSFKKYFVSGLETVLVMWLSVLPTIMAVGTIALILSEYTPLFSYLGLPFYPILQLFGVNDALAASSTMVVGFADMVVPSILAAGIESEMTRFIVASLSVSQLIYMSETGSILLGCKIPLSLSDLFIIFIERTIVSLPIIVLIAHIFF